MCNDWLTTSSAASPAIFRIFTAAFSHSGLRATAEVHVLLVGESHNNAGGQGVVLVQPMRLSKQGLSQGKGGGSQREWIQIHIASSVRQG